MGIKHRADSAFRKSRLLSKLSFGRTVKCFKMPYVSYPRPLCGIQRKPTRKQAHLVFADTQNQRWKTKRARFVANAQRKIKKRKLENA